jgi:hypothetical protein
MEDEVTRNARHAELIAFIQVSGIRMGGLVSKSVFFEVKRRVKELSALMKKTREEGRPVSAADKGFLEELLACVKNNENPTDTVGEAAVVLSDSLMRALKMAHLPASGKFFVVKPAKMLTDCDGLFQKLSEQAYVFGVPLDNPLPKPDSPESSTYEDSDDEISILREKHWEMVKKKRAEKAERREAEREKKIARELAKKAAEERRDERNAKHTRRLNSRLFAARVPGVSSDDGAAGGGSGSAAGGSAAAE